MDWQIFFRLTPYVVSLAISAGVSFYAWRHRNVTGAGPYALCVLLQASWTLGYVFELASLDLESKTFWDNTQFVGMLIAPMALLAFACEYTGYRPAHPRRLWGGLTAASIAFLVLVFSDDLHRWVRPAAWLVAGEPFLALVYDFGPLAWATFVYAYGLYLSAAYLLVRKLFHTQRLYRAQIATILIGTLIPIIGTVLTAMGLTAITQRDVTPFTFAVGNLVIAWGLFRYRLFDIVPVARDRVIEGMRDAVVVVDVQGRVADLNLAALEIAGRSAPQVIGQPLFQVFSSWPDLVGHYQDTQEASAEFLADVAHGQRCFDLSLSPLYDQRDRLVGRLIVMRDATERVRAQDELKRYRDQLEVLVGERTEALTAANEQLRQEVAERTQAEEALKAAAAQWQATFDAVADSVCLLGLDGTVLRCNEATPGLLARPMDELVGGTCWELVHGTSEPIEECPLERMRKTGRRATQVLPMDERWIEITADPVLDGDGDLVGAVHIMADITERVRAEGALQKSERLLNTILAATPVGIGRVQGHRLSWVNEAMCHILGWERAAFLGTSVRTIYPDDLEYERAGQELYARFAETGFGQAEARLQRKDGTVVQCIVAIQTLNVADPSAGHILAITDISERRRAEEALREYAERLRILHEIDRGILAARAPEEIAQAAVSGIRRLVSCPRTSVILIDSVTRSARIAAVDAEGDAVVPAGASVAFGAVGGWSREAGELLRQGQVYTVEDYAMDSEFDEKLHPEEARSLILVPIRSQGELIGILSLAGTNPAALSQENLDIARQVADQLAIAIQQANLRDQVQRHADELEQRVIDRTRELSALYEVAALASQPLDLETILGRSLDQVLEAVDGDAGVIHLVDVGDVSSDDETPREGVLHLLVHQGLPPDVADEVESLPADGGLVGWVIDHDEPLIVPDITADGRTGLAFPVEPRAYVGVPLRAGGQTLGVLSIVRRTDQPSLTVEELSMLTSVADQLGTVVESVRLHEQAERAAVLEERGRLARELHDSVTQLLYSINLFAKAGRDAYSQGNVERGNEHLAKLGDTASQAIKEMRLLLYELRPRELEQQGLIGAIQHRLDAVEGRAGVTAQLLANATIQLPTKVEQELYHIVQEALNNALKHSEATSVKVQIEADAKGVRLEVTDNGSGFNPHGASSRGGIGLASMRERAERAGGKLTILSEPGKGTTIQFSLKA